ncbi:MAG: hypothetical protein ACE5IZ_01610 [Dehalococcoidia bacterium]
MRQVRRLAVYCRHLRRTIDPGRREGERIIGLCTHVVRDGEECVGPFLDSLESQCGLWEARPEERRL